MSHLCSLRARLCQLRTQLLMPAPGAGAKGEGFDVEKQGDARVALIGFPSVGKSTILSTFTSTKSEAASYEFTTLVSHLVQPTLPLTRSPTSTSTSTSTSTRTRTRTRTRTATTTTTTRRAS